MDDVHGLLVGFFYGARGGIVKLALQTDRHGPIVVVGGEPRERGGHLRFVST